MAADSPSDCIVSDVAAPGKNALVGGPFGSNLVSKDYAPSGVPVIRGQNMGDGRWVGGEFAFVTPAKADSLAANMARPRDIVFTQRGTLGQVAIVPRGSFERYLISQSQMKLTVDESKADVLFLYYLFTSPKQQAYIRNNAIQVGVPHTNLGILRNTPIKLPPLPEQKAIAAMLGALDDKIELNRRMNATLEAMARALFQSWFVDFDPVRAKAEGRPPAGLDEPTAALFPAQFQDSELGPIPQGWEVDRFDVHITADRGLSYKGEGLRDNGTGLPMHNLNSIFEGGGYKHAGIKYYEGDYREKHLVESGDMIVTNTEQGFDHLLIGHAAIVPRCFGTKGIFSHHIYRVRFKKSSPLSPHYLVELFNNRRWHYWISGFSNGTTINMLPKDALEMPLLVVPPAELVRKFTALAQAAHEQIEDNIHQSRTLATLRDTLLPKLLSGDLTVTDPE